MLTWAGVALFGALGAVARFRVDAAVSGRVGGDFPAGILVVNLTGAFALGFAYAAVSMAVGLAAVVGASLLARRHRYG